MHVWGLGMTLKRWSEDWATSDSEDTPMLRNSFVEIPNTIINLCKYPPVRDQEHHIPLNTITLQGFSRKFSKKGGGKVDRKAHFRPHKWEA